MLSFLLLLAVAVVRMRNLFAVVVLTGIYSLHAALLFVELDAVDVAFTEAAVGAGISTVLMLATLALVGREERRPTRSRVLPLAVVLATGAVLVYGTLELPPFADPSAPIHQHVAPRYIAQGPVETGVPNMVTGVLASYRGFDTLGEIVVILTAGVGVLLLLGRGRRREGERDGS